MASAPAAQSARVRDLAESSAALQLPNSTTELLNRDQTALLLSSGTPEQSGDVTRTGWILA
jgi:hypothetical protein